MKTRKLLLGVLAACLLSACGKKTDAPLPAPPAADNATNQPAPVASPGRGFAKLIGKWERPDGGYVIEIKNVTDQGMMDAAYFNPNPIHVSRAEASSEGGGFKVFIELRAPNYPGSTYDLVYDAPNDQLTGIYFQAAYQQRYEVFFVRMK